MRVVARIASTFIKFVTFESTSTSFIRVVVLNEHQYFLRRAERACSQSDLVFLFVFCFLMRSKRTVAKCIHRLGAGRELGDSLGAFGDGVLGEFTREDQSHRRLDLTGRDRRLLVVASELGGFGRNLFEDVVDEGVHDGHRLGRNAGVRVHLLQHLVDVNLVRLRLRLAATLLGASGLLGCGLLTGHVD